MTGWSEKAGDAGSGAPVAPDVPGRDPGLPRFAWAVALLGLGVIAVRLAGGPDRLPAELGIAADLAGSAPVAPADDSAKTIFVDQGCGACHALDASRTARGPGLGGVGERAEARIRLPDYGGQATDVDGYLAEAILNHCADVVPGFMCPDVPDIGLRLGTTELEALVAYLRDLPPSGEAP